MVGGCCSMFVRDLRTRRCKVAKSGSRQFLLIAIAIVTWKGRRELRRPDVFPVAPFPSRLILALALAGELGRSVTLARVIQQVYLCMCLEIKHGELGDETFGSRELADTGSKF